MRLLSLAVAAMAMSLSVAALALNPALDRIQRNIEKRYPQVRHITAGDFAALKSNDLIVFDVRAQKEYDVSHLHGAVRVDPGIAAAEFARQYGERISGKTIVFYCSVGQRSSRLAARISNSLADGARKSFNLSGGLFHWLNEQRPVVVGDKATRFVHPYNFFWGRLLDDRKAIRYKPERPL